MDMQNIGVNNRDDAFYRYKMPKMNTKIEGRGNGIKTNVVNMVEIAKALARPASYTTKYFGCELGAQSKFDEKTGIPLVNGAHGTGILEGLLENFIRKYVQCYNCQNPETEILITKSQMIQLKCAACGFLSDVDMRDKLTSFILKNPPETKKGSKDKKAMRRAEKERLKEGDAADEEQKKLKKESKKKTSSKDVTVKTGLSKKKANGSDEDRTPLPTPSPSPTVDEDEDSEYDVEWQTDTSLEAARLQIQEQLNSVTAEMVMLSTHDEDKKKKTKAANSEKKNGSPKSSSLPAAEDNGKIENGGKRHEMLVQEAKAYLKKGVAADQFRPSSAHSSAASAQELMTALYEAILGDTEKGFAKEIAKKKKYLAAAVAQSEESQSLLLGGIKEFCKKQNPAAAAAVAVKEVALVLKALYDGDILEEEYIVQWYQQGLTGGNKDSPVWKNAKPFVDWLQSSESESDGE